MGQNFGQHSQNRKSWDKDRNFRAVTDERNENNDTLDVFINVMQSNSIRQRLLENKSLDLQTPLVRARSLETAQQSHA